MLPSRCTPSLAFILSVFFCVRPDARASRGRSGNSEEHGQLATPLDGPGRKVSGVERSQDLSASNRSAKPWKNGRSPSSPQRSSHIASVSPLSHQRSGWTTPRTGQPRVLASRETPLHGWRTDHIVPAPRVSSPLSAPSPDGGGRGTLRRLLGRHRGQTRRRSSPRLDRTVTSTNVLNSPVDSRSERGI